jgi:hypothetical protein
MLFLALIVSTLSTAHAGCPTDGLPASSVVDEVDQAIDAFSALDEEAFVRHYDNSLDALPCLSEPMSRSDAVYWHQVAGMVRFMDGDTAAARPFFQSAQWSGGRNLPRSVAPIGGPLERFYTASETPPTEKQLEAPEHVTVYVNGERSTVWPSDFPVLMLVEDEKGVTWTGLLSPGDQLPSWPESNEVIIDTEEEPPPLADLDEEVEPLLELVDLDAPIEPLPNRAPQKVKKRSGKGGLIAATIVSGVVAGGLFATSAGLRTTYDQNPDPSTRNIVNSTYFASMGTGALTVGLGVATIAIPSKNRSSR